MRGWTGIHCSVPSPRARQQACFSKLCCTGIAWAPEPCFPNPSKLDARQASILRRPDPETRPACGADPIDRKSRLVAYLCYLFHALGRRVCSCTRWSDAGTDIGCTCLIGFSLLAIRPGSLPLGIISALLLLARGWRCDCCCGINALKLPTEMSIEKRLVVIRKKPWLRKDRTKTLNGPDADLQCHSVSLHLLFFFFGLLVASYSTPCPALDASLIPSIRDGTQDETLPQEPRTVDQSLTLTRLRQSPSLFEQVQYAKICRVVCAKPAKLAKPGSRTVDFTPSEAHLRFHVTNVEHSPQ